MPQFELIDTPLAKGGSLQGAARADGIVIPAEPELPAGRSLDKMLASLATVRSANPYLQYMESFQPGYDAVSRTTSMGGLGTLLADDLTFHGPYGTVSTKAEFIENLRSGRLGYDSITAQEPLARLHSEAAIVMAKRTFTFILETGRNMRACTSRRVWLDPPHWHMLAWQSTLHADANV